MGKPDLFRHVVNVNISMLTNSVQALAFDYSVKLRNTGKTDQEVRELAVAFFYGELSKRLTEKLTREL